MPLAGVNRIPIAVSEVELKWGPHLLDGSGRPVVWHSEYFRADVL